jgi:hypothetical protein
MQCELCSNIETFCSNLVVLEGHYFNYNGDQMQLSLDPLTVSLARRKIPVVLLTDTNSRPDPPKRHDCVR